MNQNSPPAAPLQQSSVSQGSRPSWLVCCAGLAVMYWPVLLSAIRGNWQTDVNGHGPLVLAVIIWLFWSVRRAVDALHYEPASWAGWPLFVLGLAVYFLGRAFRISSLEFASLIPLVCGGLLILRGFKALRAAWFPLFYLAFLIPLPASFVDAVTAPLKQWISLAVSNILYQSGYPIASTGVLLTVGKYQLLVADACSGLNSMFSLTALGTLFMFLMNRKRYIHNLIMLASILPIAFGANVIRVIVLVLITFHFGDEAGQGFLHNAAGIALMVASLTTLFALDWILHRSLRSEDVRPMTAISCRSLEA